MRVTVIAAGFDRDRRGSFSAPDAGRRAQRRRPSLLDDAGTDDFGDGDAGTDEMDIPGLRPGMIRSGTARRSGLRSLPSDGDARTDVGCTRPAGRMNSTSAHAWATMRPRSMAPKVAIGDGIRAIRGRPMAVRHGRRRWSPDSSSPPPTVSPHRGSLSSSSIALIHAGLEGPRCRCGRRRRLAAIEAIWGTTSTVAASIGPHIRSCCYAVGAGGHRGTSADSPQRPGAGDADQPISPMRDHGRQPGRHRQPSVVDRSAPWMIRTFHCVIRARRQHRIDR